MIKHLFGSKTCTVASDADMYDVDDSSSLIMTLSGDLTGFGRLWSPGINLQWSESCVSVVSDLGWLGLACSRMLAKSGGGPGGGAYWVVESAGDLDSSNKLGYRSCTIPILKLFQSPEDHLFRLRVLTSLTYAA